MSRENFFFLLFCIDHMPLYDSMGITNSLAFGHGQRYHVNQAKG